MYMCIYKHIYIYICICIYRERYVYMYICIYIYICVFMYTVFIYCGDIIRYGAFLCESLDCFLFVDQISEFHAFPAGYTYSY